MLETAIVDCLVDIVVEKEIAPATAVGGGVNIIATVLTVLKIK